MDSHLSLYLQTAVPGHTDTTRWHQITAGPQTDLIPWFEPWDAVHTHTSHRLTWVILLNSQLMPYFMQFELLLEFLTILLWGFIAS